MSGEEKAAQIGAAVTEYQDAKVNAAHIDKKISMVADAFYVAAEALRNNRTMVDAPIIEADMLRFPYSKNPNCAQLLLNEAGLIKLLREREGAQQRLKKAHEEMTSLGITNLQ
jgi:hypothetical protein